MKTYRSIAESYFYAPDVAIPIFSGILFGRGDFVALAVGAGLFLLRFYRKNVFSFLFRRCKPFRKSYIGLFIGSVVFGVSNAYVDTIHVLGLPLMLSLIYVMYSSYTMSDKLIRCAVKKRYGKTVSESNCF